MAFSKWYDLFFKLDCGEYKTFLTQLLAYRPAEFHEWRTSYAYPQNLLRNVAKAGCQTEFTYVPDIGKFV